MQVSRKSVPEPDRGGEQRLQPEILPEKPRSGRSRRWWLAGLALVAAIAGAYWIIQRQGVAASVVETVPIRSAPVSTGSLDRTIRLSGTTAAEKYVNIVSPRLRGSRSRRGSSFSGGSIGVKSNVTVRTTSSVASSATMSSLSQTGTVTSSSGASRGGGSGGATSSRMQAATSRLGGSSRSSSTGGNVSQAAKAAETAMGSSGLGTTASNLTGGRSGPPTIGGGGRSRGDFHLVLEKLIEPGARVRKGEIIAEFDQQYMLTRMDDYEASVAQHEADLTKSKADIEVSREAHDHSVEAAKGALEQSELDMRTIPVLSQIQAERTKLDREESEAEYNQLLDEVPYVRVSEEAEIREAELDLEEARVELQRTQNSLNRLVVEAPIDGMVVMLNVYRSGEFGQVQEGDTLHSGQPFLQVVDTSSMIINADVNQVDVDQLRIGMKARVRFDAFPDLELPAKLYSIGTVAKASQFRREYVTTVPVQLRLDKLDPRVIPDLSVSADVILETDAEEAPTLPAGSVFTDDESGKQYVYVKTGAGWEKRWVDVRLQNHVAALVASGIEPGEEVALEHPAEKVEQN